MNFRPTWELEVTQPTSGNYYPVTSKISINDFTTDIARHFAVINDRSQGGTSLKNGEVELMVSSAYMSDVCFINHLTRLFISNYLSVTSQIASR